MTLDAGHKELVSVTLRVLNEVGWCLLGGDGDERYTLVGGLKPDNLGTFNGTARFIALVAFAFTAFRLLFFLGRCRRRTEKTESAREQLTRHALHDGDNVTGELWLHLVSDPTTK